MKEFQQLWPSLATYFFPLEYRMPASFILDFGVFYFLFCFLPHQLSTYTYTHSSSFLTWHRLPSFRACNPLIVLMWKLCMLTLANSSSGMPSSGFISEETSFYPFQDWKTLQNEPVKQNTFHFFNFQKLKLSVIIVIIVEINNDKECSENSC